VTVVVFVTLLVTVSVAVVVAVVVLVADCAHPGLVATNIATVR